MYHRLGAALLVAMVFGVGCTDRGDDPLALAEQPAIYGGDDRQEVYAHPDATLRAIAASGAVALLDPSLVSTVNGTNIVLGGMTLGVEYELCAGERFFDQPSPAYCSGMLIDDDLVLTAGHCVVDQSDCRNTSFLFHYFYSAAGVLGPMTVDDLFGCKQLVVRDIGPDYAIVQLDRPATPRFQPAPVHRGPVAVSLGEPVSVMGCGSGLPVKIDSGGHVIDVGNNSSTFGATTDTFGGNSGSSLFNAAHEVIGVLIEGAEDYTWTSAGCYIAADYPANGGVEGEYVTFVDIAIDALCASGWSTPLCAQGSVCEACTSASACPSGWRCASQIDGVDRCQPPCAGPSDCPAGHVCESATGTCAPETTIACSGREVWASHTCGAPLRLATCATGEVCEDGACIVPCTDACALGATRCAGNAVEGCLVGRDGCSIWGPSSTCGADQECSGTSCVQADAWCRACATRDDCPSGWTCHANGDRSVTWCARTCADDSDCAADHLCVDTVCAPRQSDVCRDNAVWRLDSCGHTLAEVEACPAATTCVDGQCACTDACAVGELRCADQGTPELCGAQPSGCTAWEPAATCSAAQVCALGLCQSDAPGETGDTDANTSSVRTADDGCGCRMATPASSSSVPVGVSCVLLGVCVARRRRRGAPRR